MDSSLHKNITAHYFETTASATHQSSKEHYEFAAAQLARHLGPWLPESTAHCLDLACGCGELLYLLQSRGIKNLAGVDLSSGELREAKKFVDAQLTEADIVSFLSKEPAQSRDNIFALNIFEHLSLDSLFEVMKECRRVLRPGGAIVAMVPNACSPFGGMTRYWDITHLRAFSPNSISQVARASGFTETLEFRECAPRPHGLFSTIRFVLWQLYRLAIYAHNLVQFGNSKGGIYSADMLVRIR